MKAYVIGATWHLGTELVRRIEELNIPVIKTYASTVLQGGTKFDLSQDDLVWSLVWKVFLIINTNIIEVIIIINTYAAAGTI